MFTMKIEALVFSIVVCLTLIVPGAAYVVMSGDLQSQADSYLSLAQKSEELAKSIKETTSPLNKESLISYMRIQAENEKKLSTVFLDFKSTSKKFLLSMAWIALLQFSILTMVLIRRNNITRRSTPVPSGAG